MSFKATLTIEGKSFDILEYRCLLEQQFDPKGRPASGVKGGDIDMILAGTADNTFSNWIVDPTSRKDGSITFFRIDQNSKFKEIKFKGAYLIRLTESCITPPADSQIESRIIDNVINKGRETFDQIMRFHARTSMSYIIHCNLSAEKITIDGVDHDNQW